MSAERTEPVIPQLGIAVTSTMFAIWVVVSGELDASNVELLAASLPDLPETETRPVELVLAGLTFCDVRGAHLLVDYVTCARRRGHPVTTSGARAPLQRLARMVSDDAIDLAGACGP